MALTGTLTADFNSFYEACQKAEVVLKGFESSTTKVATSLDKMVDGFSGRKVISEATLMAEAITRLGTDGTLASGLLTLTEKELDRVGNAAKEAAAKLTAMGEKVPEHIQQLADTVKNVVPPLDTLNKLIDDFSGRQLIADAIQMAAAVEGIGGMSKLTEKELKTFGGAAAEAAAKMVAMGIDVPPNIQKLADTVKKVPPPLDDLNKKLPETTGFFADLSGSILKTAAGFISAEAVMALASTAFRTFTDFLKASVSAFIDADAGQVKLNAALRQASLATPEVIAQYAALGETFQRTTVFSAGQIASVETLLTQVGGLMPSQMRGAVKASTDLASALGLDLTTATNLVAKAAMGNTTALGKYGVVVSDAALASKGFDAVLESVERKFGGSAAADMETYAGKLKQIANAWADVQEASGKFLVQNPFTELALRATAAAFGENAQAAREARPTVTGILESFGAIPSGLQPALLALEAYVEELNAAAKQSAFIAGLPLPFAKIAGTLPPITEGMRLFNLEVEQHAKDVKAAEAAEDRWKGAMVELNSVGGNWQTTLDGISGSVVEAIKYYLEAGVSQGTLAAAYYLTAGQIKAIATSMSEEAAAIKILGDLNKDYLDKVKGLNDAYTARLPITEKAVAAILAESAAQITLNESMGLDAMGRAKVKTAAEILQRGLEDLAKTRVGEISQTAQMQVLYDAYNKSVNGAAAATTTATGALAAVPGVANAAASAINNVTRSYWAEVDAAFAAHNAALVAAGMTPMPDIGHRPNAPGTGVNQGGGGTGLGGVSDGGLHPLDTHPLRDAGGPVSLGQSYLIGLNRQPEIFTPGASGFVTPMGGGSSTSVVNHIYVNGTAEEVARKIAAEIAKSYGRGNKF